MYFRISVDIWTCGRKLGTTLLNIHSPTLVKFSFPDGNAVHRKPGTTSKSSGLAGTFFEFQKNAVLKYQHLNPKQLMIRVNMANNRIGQLVLEATEIIDEKISSGSFIVVLSKLPKLCRLRVFASPGWPREPLFALLHKNTKLQHLHIPGCTLSDEQLANLLKQMPELVTLDIEGSDLPHALITIAKHCPGLSSLNCSRVPLASYGGQLRVLAESCTKLQTLTLGPAIEFWGPIAAMKSITRFVSGSNTASRIVQPELVGAVSDIQRPERMIQRYSPPNVGANFFYFDGTQEKTLLHHVVQQGAPNDVVRHVLSLGADINARDSVFGYTPLLTAAKVGELRLLQFLLSNGADATACLKDSSDSLLLSAKMGKKEVFDFLINSGYPIKKRDALGRTPPMVAVAHGPPNTVKYFCNLDVHNQLGLDINSIDNAGAGILHYVCKSSPDEDLLTRLLGWGADPSLRTNKGATVLHSLIRGNASEDVLGRLYDRVKNQVNIKNSSGATPFHRACRRKQAPIVQLLLRMGADVNLPTSKGVPAIALACMNGSDISKLLLEACGSSLVVPPPGTILNLVHSGSRINIADEVPVTHPSMLYLAAFHGDDVMLGIYLPMLAESDFMMGDVPLLNILLKMAGNRAAVERLIQSPACTWSVVNRSYDSGNVLVSGHAVTPLTPLHTAILRSPSTTATELLLKNGADIFATTSDGMNSLHIACLRHEFKIMKILGRHGRKELYSSVDNKGRGALWYLFRHAVDNFSTDVDRWKRTIDSVLVAGGYAAPTENLIEPLVLGLDSIGGDVTIPEYAKEAFRIAIKLKANTDFIGPHGASSVLFAIQVGDEDLLQQVLATVSPATLNSLYRCHHNESSLFQTPLHYAVRRAQPFVKHLVNAGAKLIPNSIGETPLKIAQQLLAHNIVSLLEQHSLYKL